MTSCTGEPQIDEGSGEIFQRLRQSLPEKNWNPIVSISATEIEINGGPELWGRERDSAPLAADTSEVQRRAVSMGSDPSIEGKANNKYARNKLEGELERRSHDGASDQVTRSR